MKFKSIIIIIFSVAFIATGCARTKKAIDVLINDDQNTEETSSNTSTEVTQEKLTSPKPPPRRLPDGSNRFKVPSEGMVWIENGGRLHAIDSESALLEASIGQAFKQAFLFSMKNKVAVVANGTSAFKRINTTKPTFYTKYKPSDIGIGRFILQPEKNRRYVWVTSQTGSNIMYIYPYENAVGFDYSKVGNGIYKVVLRENLEPGEYGIGTGMNSSPVLYNFGIEENATSKTSSGPSLMQQAQERLASLGFDPGKPDGIYGKRTGIALSEFQKSRGIPATGKLDDRTIKELNISK